MHDRAGALGRVYDFVSRPVQDLVIVGLHPNAYALARETRQTTPPLRAPSLQKVEKAMVVTGCGSVKIAFSGETPDTLSSCQFSPSKKPRSTSSGARAYECGSMVQLARPCVKLRTLSE